MNLTRPFPLAVIIGFGTVFALSILLIVLAEGLPVLLYDVSGWLRRGVSNPLFGVLPLLSLFGYVETGIMYAFFLQRDATRTAGATTLDLVDEVGVREVTTPGYVQKGALAGALAGLFASLLSLPVFLVMTYVQLPDGLRSSTVMVGSAMMAGVSLIIAVILGAIFGGIGGMIGSRMKPRIPVKS